MASLSQLGVPHDNNDDESDNDNVVTLVAAWVAGSHLLPLANSIPVLIQISLPYAHCMQTEYRNALDIVGYRVQLHHFAAR